MLTVIAVKNAAPRPKDYKIADGGGLYLYVTKNGHKSWRFKYRFGGKERRIVFGAFPEMTLAEAREKRDEARRQVRDGKDPALVAKRTKLLRSTPSAVTFEIFARAWYSNQKDYWKPVHASDVITSLERDVFPELGAFDVADIDETMVLAVLDKVQARGAVETAHRLRQRISAVFRYAKGKGATSSNPAADITVAMKRIPTSRSRPAFVTLPEAREMLRTVEHAGASPITKAASRVLALTAQRPGMIRRLRWSQISGIDWQNPDSDISQALWTVPAEEMKQELELRENEAFRHMIPLAPQAADVLRVIRRLTGNSEYVFPSGRSMLDPMSENAIGYLYNREGFQRRHCPHGWRSSFSTIMNERIGEEVRTDETKAFNRLVIDLMLAHLPKGLSEEERTYNRAAYMKRRREIAEEWADLLTDGLEPAASLLLGPRRRYRD